MLPRSGQVDQSNDGMRIGELARRTATSTRSLRYYEHRGLISADRDHNGYRRYPDNTVQLVANLRRLLDAGLSIDDIHQFGSCVRALDLDTTPCTSGLEIYERRLAALDTKIATLNHLRSALAEQAEQLRRNTPTRGATRPDRNTSV